MVFRSLRHLVDKYRVEVYSGLAWFFGLLSMFTAIFAPNENIYLRIFLGVLLGVVWTAGNFFNAALFRNHIRLVDHLTKVMQQHTTIEVMLQKIEPGEK